MINNKLYEAALKNPSSNIRSIYLNDLCKKISDGDFILPIFQTYLRWNAQKQASLFNYQLFGKSPVSPLSANVIDDPKNVSFVQQVSFVSRELISTEEEVRGKFSIADGQQRLSTNYLAYIGDSSLDKVVLDIHRAKFIVLEDEKIKDFQIPVTVLYNKVNSLKDYVREHMGGIKRMGDLFPVLSNVRTNWMQYTYNINIATNMNEKEQKDWFNVLNLAGSRVTQDMVFLSDLLVQGVDFYKEYAQPFRDMMEEHDLLSLYPRKSAEVSIPLAALNAAYERVENIPVHVLNRSPLPSDTQPKVIAKVTPDEIRKMFSLSLQALESSLQYFKEQPQPAKRIDYITNVMGYFIFSNSHTVDDKARVDIQDWAKPDLFTNKSNGERREIFQSLIAKTNNIIIKTN